MYLPQTSFLPGYIHHFCIVYLQYARIFCVLHFEFGIENYKISSDRIYFTIYIPLSTSWSFTFSDAVTAVSKSIESSTLSSESLSGITRGDSVWSKSLWNLKLIFFSITGNNFGTNKIFVIHKYSLTKFFVMINHGLLYKWTELPTRGGSFNPYNVTKTHSIFVKL